MGPVEHELLVYLIEFDFQARASKPEPRLVLPLLPICFHFMTDGLFEFTFLLCLPLVNFISSKFGTTLSQVDPKR